jgi:Na+/melibiose symporter-like transporter
LTDQGSVYVEFIVAEIQREYDRRDRIDTRCAALVTAAAGLITISFAALAALKGKNAPIHGVSLACITVTVIAFVSSAVLATLAAANWSYEVAKSSTLSEMLSSHWQDSQVTARNHTARINVRTLRTLRTGNNRKSTLFLAALLSQVVAITGLAVTILATS